MFKRFLSLFIGNPPEKFYWVTDDPEKWRLYHQDRADPIAWVTLDIESNTNQPWWICEFAKDCDDHGWHGADHESLADAVQTVETWARHHYLYAIRKAD